MRPIATSSNFLKCTYLKERIGQTFQGLITTVVEFGCFVQILDVAVDGLLHIDNLRDDDYVMEDDGHGWRGTAQRPAPAHRRHVRVMVTAVNPIEGLIDLALAEDGVAAYAPDAMPTSPQGTRRSTVCTPCASCSSVMPQRVLRVQLAERRDDARVRVIEELARRHAAPGPARRCRSALQQLLGEVAHQGVAAEIAPLAPWGEDELLAALQAALAPLLLALDGVQDPHNLGACLRTADACGALAVIVPRDRAAQLTPAVRKVAAGAAETHPGRRGHESGAYAEAPQGGGSVGGRRRRGRGAGGPTPWISRERWCWCWVRRAADCGT